jgi:hypothetical protein
VRLVSSIYKVKLSLCLTKHLAEKVYGGAEEQLYLITLIILGEIRNYYVLYYVIFSFLLLLPPF